jgi:hypothetical protein
MADRRSWSCLKCNRKSMSSSACGPTPMSPKKLAATIPSSTSPVPDVGTANYPNGTGRKTGKSSVSLPDGAHKNTAVETMRPNSRPADLNVQRRRSEIPDTPDQRSSQFQIESTAPKSSMSHVCTSSNAETQDQATAAAESEQQPLDTERAKLCHACKKLTVMTDRNGRVDKWYVLPAREHSPPTLTFPV